MSNKLIVFLLALVTWLSFSYTYHKGMQDGEAWYKQSHRMYMALESAYKFGWVDGHNGKPENWDGD